jgi:plastocyanin
MPMSLSLGIAARRRLCGAILAGLAAVAVWPQPASAEDRFFTVLAVEPRGGVTADREPFPTQPLPGGGGYVTNPPNAQGRWEVSAYIWQPSQIVVNQGDRVTLEFVGINGAEHPTMIAAFGQSFTLKRGHAHRVIFVADRAGMFGFVCGTHQPSMTGALVVLPKP